MFASSSRGTYRLPRTIAFRTITTLRRWDMVTDPGNADEPRPAEPANGNGSVEGGELPQPDPESFVPPETDFGLLTSDAQDSAEVERAFSEAKEALEAQLQFGPEWGPRSAAQENG